MQQCGLPLAGEILTQDPLLVDRALEGGSRYQIADKDLDVYRKPFPKVLLQALGNGTQFAAPGVNGSRIRFSQKPTLIVWGPADPLPLSMAQTLHQPQANGHYPQSIGMSQLWKTLYPFSAAKLFN